MVPYPPAYGARSASRGTPNVMFHTSTAWNSGTAWSCVRSAATSPSQWRISTRSPAALVRDGGSHASAWVIHGPAAAAQGSLLRPDAWGKGGPGPSSGVRSAPRVPSSPRAPAGANRPSRTPSASSSGASPAFRSVSRELASEPANTSASKRAGEYWSTGAAPAGPEPAAASASASAIPRTAERFTIPTPPSSRDLERAKDPPTRLDASHRRITSREEYILPLAISRAKYTPLAGAAPSSFTAQDFVCQPAGCSPFASVATRRPLTS